MIVNTNEHYSLLSKPEHLIRLDGAGALVSACMLGVILPRFEAIFGVPLLVLYILASLACFLVLFSVGSLVLGRPSLGRVLRILASANLSYFCITIGLLLANVAGITVWGWVYFGLELSIVLALAAWEWRHSHVEADPV